MDAKTIMGIRPALTAYLGEFEGCMGRAPNLGHLETYVTGQLGDLPRKSIEPMADAADVPARTLQEFLGIAQWDESAARDRLQQRVARRHTQAHSIGIIDETSFAKKGDKTACVQRQHCGSRGKTDNCVVSVHLGYVAGTFTRCSTATCTCPRRRGTPIGPAAAPRAFPTTWCTARSRTSPWSSTSGRGATACASSG